MNRLTTFILHPFVAPGLVAFLSVVILGTAYYFQYGLGLAPCELCYWQRYPYFIAIALAGLVQVFNARGQGTTLAGRIVMALIAFVFLVNAGIGLYHVGVEQHWWAGPTACTGVAGGGVPGSVDELLATPVVRCDEVAWSLFGISMAGYNVLLSLGLAGYAVIVVGAWRKERAI